jgi:hypothetical protein
VVTRKEMKSGLTTSIVIKVETKEKLGSCSSSMKDTYDTVICKVCDHYLKTRGILQ